MFITGREAELLNHLDRESREERNHLHRLRNEEATWEVWDFEEGRNREYKRYPMHGTEWKDGDVLKAFGLDADGIKIECDNDGHIVVKRHDGHWIGEMIRNDD